MKKAASILTLAALVLVAAGMLAAGSHTKSQTWTGWISDSACAAKGAAASHNDCAVKCVKEKGATWVFVNDEGKVLPIHNQDAVKEDSLGKKVKVTGYLMDDGSLHVEKIEAAG